MPAWTNRLPSAASLTRIALAAFVVAWLLELFSLRSLVPIWPVFLIALGLELQFFVSGLRPGPPRRADRGPQPVDRERYGYEDEADDLLLVREGGEELWIPYAGETPEEIEGLVEEERERREQEAEAPPVVVPAQTSSWPAVRRFLTGLTVIGALALVLWVVESRTGWDAVDAEARAEAAARFSAEASRIAGKPVTIRCDDAGEYVGAVQHADGVAVVGGELAYLAPARCHDLYRLAFEGETRSSQTARALAVLAHEAWHLRGVRDEGATECYALQSGVELGRRLGLSDDSAQRLMRQQLAENSLRTGGSLEYRVPPDCRDGGRLDLDPSTKSFP
jgi:hypothetical protein